jgi:LysM repeat protein
LLRVVVVLAVFCGFVAAGASAAPDYRVRPGDTLTAIAQQYRTTVERLERLNRLSPTAPLLAGATLRLPPPKMLERRYLVSPGDTLGGIAERFHTTATAIAAASGIEVTQPILIGATLRVPVTSGVGSAVAISFYRVRAGDTLSGIALRDGASLGALTDLNHLDPNAPLVVGTRLAVPFETIADAPQAYSGSSVRRSIVHWADHYRVNRHLVAALAWMESGFNNELVSPAGAVGVMQITPDTWNYVEQVLLLGESVPHTPDGNVRIGVAYLHHLLHIYDGGQHEALAAYYQGARSLQQDGLLPGTGQYVDDILALEKRL